MGKGSRPRTYGRVYAENYEAIFGKDHKPSKGHWVFDDGKSEPTRYGKSPNIIGAKPTFNIGLGCYTDNTRHAEQIARSRGLAAIGDTPLEHFQKKGDDQFKQEMKSTLEEGVKAARAGKTLEGERI